jgi:hypothetical protein
MKIGIDFYGTITKDPKVYKLLAETVLAAEGSVYIITAIAEHNRKQVLKDIRKSHVPYSEIHVVPYTEWHQVPGLKKQVAFKLELDMIIDDRLDVLRACESIGILGFLSV